MDPVRSDSVDQGEYASSEMKVESKLVTQQQEPVSGEQPELRGHSPATDPPIPATDASSSSRLAISNKPRVEAQTLAIHDAVFAGDVSSVEAYIARNADKILKFRRPSATATTALVPPTSGIAALLVDPAAPKSDADSGGVSPLEVVNLRGRTPLHTACVGGHIRVVEVLLAAGADANAFDNAGFSPLHRCAQSSDLHSARALLDRNKCSGGRGGASPAAGDASAVACANSDVDVPTRRGDYRAIHLACYAGSADMVSLLARRGADVSAGDKWGASPLHRACLEGHLEAARAVLDAGAEVDSRDSWKSTPLHRACHSGHADIVNLLLRRGAATSAKDDIMQRPGQSFDNDVTNERRQVIAALLKEGEKSRSTSSSIGTIGNTPWPEVGAWSRARNTADPSQGKERSPSRYVPPAARVAAAAAAAAEVAAASGPIDSAGGGDRDTPELTSTTSAVQPWRRKTFTWTGLSEDPGPDVDVDGVGRSDGSSAAVAVGRRGEEGHGKFGDGFAQAGSGPGREEEEEEEDDEDFDDEIFELEVVGVRDGAGSETLSDCHPTTDWGLRSFDGAPKTAFPSYHN
ncbi:unnamed protein product [Ectocarpus sp. 12 AP-2014]